MVSQPDTALALRGAASVVGGSHHHRGGSSSSHVSSRARRYNRSHAGGSSGAGSYAPQNEFPIFGTSGDVEILVRVPSGHENRYLLHRHTLTRCSGFFEASTSNEWSRAQPLPALPASNSGAIEPAPPSSTGGELARIRDGGDGGGGGGGGRSSSDSSNQASPLGGSGAAVRRRWRYELDTGAGDGDIPMLVQKDECSPTSNLTSPNSIFGGSKATSPSTHVNSSFFRSVANLSLSHRSNQPPTPPTQAEADLLRDYDNLFRIMYNYPPVLDGINIADAYVQCKSLLALADQYDALGVAGPRVDHHLLQFRGRLWKQVAKYPISYLRLGYLARSKVIFQEALVHVVGQWPAGERSLRANLPDAVLDLIEDKVDELEEQVARVEGRLFRLSLTTRTGDRVSPATGYLDWLAVSLFRQWLADHTSPPVQKHRAGGGGGGGGGGTAASRDANGRAAATASSESSSTTSASSATGGRTVTLLPSTADGSAPLASLGRTYRTLGGSSANSNSYLGHDECKRFLKLTPELYSRDNLRRFEKRVEELRAMARDVVRPLMGSGLELEMGGRGAAEGISYLTCTSVVERDLPWAVFA